MRGQNVVQALDISADEDAQPMLLRLGLQVSDINAASINRVEYVKQVAGAIAARRAAR